MKGCNHRIREKIPRGLPRGHSLFVGVAFVVTSFQESRLGNWIPVICSVLLGGGVSLACLYGLVAVWRARLEIYPDRIRDVGLFQSTELLVKEIKGFSVLSTQAGPLIKILPKDPKAKKITIGLVLDNQKQLLEWIRQNLKDLDYTEFQKEMNAIAQDDRFGNSKTERNAALEKAWRWSKVLNTGAYAVALWLFLWPRPYELAIWTALIYPIAILFLVYRFKGLIKLDADTRRPYQSPEVATGLLFPVIVLALRAITDWDILDWNSFWFPFAQAFVLAALATFILTQGVGSGFGKFISIILMCAIYAFAGTVVLNGMLDRSEPVIYQTEIMHKRVSSGKHTSYYFDLSPWGPRNKDEEVSVGRSVYDQYEVGSNVEVLLRKGQFGISWFEVR